MTKAGNPSAKKSNRGLKKYRDRWGKRDMSRRCSICDHLQVEEINRYLATDRTLRGIAAEFRVAKSSLGRHRRHCHGVAQTACNLLHQSAHHNEPSHTQHAQHCEQVGPQSGDLRDAVKALRAEALLARPTADELLTFSSFLTMQAASVAVKKGDAIAMVRAAREARALARFEMETEEQRRQLAERPPSQVDRTLIMLTAIVGAEDDQSWAGKELQRPGDVE